ncbi:MAG: bifunctional UDP-N-acetylmuramoyl-tripeptide:D-alanyl-D-alanine ligase/alanine racemase [Chitinophagaceae bacterium]
MYTLNQIAAILSGTLQGSAQNAMQYLSVDSRKIFFPADTLFFAIITEQRDGHAYIAELYEQGVRCFIVSKSVNADHYPGAGFVVVPDVLTALQQLAAFHRCQFHIPVIGITGSNGKTIVKEWLNQLLAADYNIVRSPKSYNSQIGVPISVWQMNGANTLAIFEAGISMPGEMEALQKIIQPTTGIITNIGAAHDEGFEDRKQKLAEKLKLFTGVETLVYCKDDTLLHELATTLNVATFTWGKVSDCNIQILSVEKSQRQTTIQLLETNHHLPITNPYTLHLPFTDDASIENGMNCIALCRQFGLSVEQLSQRLLQLHPVEMRLEWKKAINNSYLINDSYSNDLSSLIIALDYLQQQRQTEKETVILSDIFQSGIADSMLYFHVAELLKQRKVERVIGIGSAISKYRQAFSNAGIDTAVFFSTNDFIKQFDTLQFKDEAILLKGSRIFGFEKIAALLERQVHQTVLEINLTALTHNLKYYRSLLQPATKMMVMVKAFGYGSGGAEVAKLLQFNKVDYLAVAYADEGVPLRQAGIHTPIMVMNAEPSTFDALYEYNLEPELYSFSILQAFLSYCQAQAIGDFPVHIKLDTGMHRLGFETTEVKELAAFLAQQNILKIKSVFTHLVASEDPAQDAFTNGQATGFETSCNQLQEAVGYSFIRHAANTAAISRHPHLQLDMVRLGIGLYGVDSGNLANLEVVSTLKSTIAQIKQVQAGETVGYNRRGIVKRDSVIATIRIGYADGYRRELSNGVGSIFVNGQAVPVIGNVCMDMTMIDITDAGALKPGDEVEVFGKNISLQSLAKSCQTIPYEIMTGISQRVKRVYFEE